MTRCFAGVGRGTRSVRMERPGVHVKLFLANATQAEFDEWLRQDEAVARWFER